MEFAWCDSPPLFSKDIHQISAFFNATQILENFDEKKYPFKLKNTFSHERKAEFIAGRYCAVKILNSIGIIKKDIFSNEDGTPNWPTDILGSITHAKNYVSVSISNNPNLLGLGRDSEFIFSKTLKKEVGSTIVQNGEMDYSKGFSEEEFITFVYSAKESLFKALYPLTKTFFDFDEVEMNGLDEKYFKIKLKKPLNKIFRAGQIFKGTYFFEKNLVHTGVDIKKGEINNSF
jgi:enterobactin synthetase component D